MYTKKTLITLIALLFLALRFAKDFRRDSGQHRNAKTFQVILLGSLVFTYSGSILYFVWLFTSFKEATLRYYSNEIGLVSGPLHFSIFILNMAATLTVLILCFLMAGRNVKARRLFFFAVPVLAFTEVFSFYQSMKKVGEAIRFSDETILVLGFVIFGGIAATNIFIYSARFMKSFFYLEMDPEDKEDNDILDDIDLTERA